MWIYVVLTLGCGSLLSLVVYLATKNGSRAAQLEAIKQEIRRIEKEQAKVQKINEEVSSLTPEEARAKLHNISNNSNKK